MLVEAEKPRPSHPYNALIRGERRQRIRKYITHTRPFGPVDSSDVNTADTAEMQELFDRNNNIYRTLESHTSVLIGRKGSGKTAYLRSTFLDAQAGPLEVVQLRTASTFLEVLKALNKELGAVYFVEVIADIWETLLMCGALSDVVAKYGRTDSALRPAADYLGKLGVNTDAPRSADDVLWTVVRTLASRKDDNVVGNLAAVIRDVAGTSYAVATSAVADFLDRTDRNVVILLDSLDEYSLDTTEVERAISGLLKCVGRFPARFERIHLRFCLPAELYHRFMQVSSNPAKDFQRCLVLRWRPQELIAIAAHRLKIYLREHHPRFYAERRLAEAEPDERKSAERILYSVLPPTITNARGSVEDTLVYLMRHTQLLPRHLLMYLNRICDRANLQDRTNAPVVCADDLLAGVHETEETIVQELFGAYKPTYPRARQVCEACLPELPQSFPQGALHKVFNRHGKAKMHSDDFAEFRKLLVEIGAVGKCLGKTERYVEGEFQYTLPNQLSISVAEELCLHPMFMRVFNGPHRLEQGPGRPAARLPHHGQGFSRAVVRLCAPRTASSAPDELEMRHVRRCNRAHELEPVQVAADALEQSLAAAEQHRHEMDLHLVHEPRRKILLSNFRSTRERNILAAGGSSRLFQR